MTSEKQMNLHVWKDKTSFGLKEGTFDNVRRLGLHMSLLGHPESS